MSFNIPIIFDDSPFFDCGDIRRPQGRGNVYSRRNPSLFEQWAEPEFFYDYPTQKQHYRPSYRGRQTKRESEYERQRKMPEEKNRFEDEEDEQEDIYDTEEHRRVRPAPRDNFGWDIPVQYMDKPTHPHHKHKQKPRKKSSKAHHHEGNQKEEPKELQRELNEARQAKEVPLNTNDKIKAESVNDEEVVKIRPEKQSKVSPEDDHMKQQCMEKPNTKASSQTTEGDDNENIEVPIEYSPPRNAQRRQSKRLSQCDPPSLADIKLARIKSVVQKIEGIEEKIAEFADPVQNKKYLYISETLMKILLDLDTVDSEGIDLVRKARKEGVQTVQALVDKLENKLEENKRNSEPE